MAEQLNTQTGIIVLAAGSSSRLGSQKQLLPVHGKSLLRHTVQVASMLQSAKLIVVLGAQADSMHQELAGTVAQPVFNNHWEEGMGASIRCGVEAMLLAAPNVTYILLLVCDQPFISAHLLQQILNTQLQTGQPIVASRYGSTFGPPVLFHQSLFPHLLAMQGAAGARKVVEQHSNRVAFVPFAAGVHDIDTKADYEMFLKQTVQNDKGPLPSAS